MTAVGVPERGHEAGSIARRTILGGAAAAAIATAFGTDALAAWAWVPDCSMPLPAIPSNLLWNHPFTRRRSVWLGGHYGSKNACSGSTSDTCSPRSYCHDGNDYSAPEGTDIYSIGPGKVVAINNSSSGSLGYTVTVDHYGAKSVYGHMKANSIAVALNQVITGVQKIGEVGATGSGTSSSAYHLHLELWVGSQTTDPSPIQSAPLPGSPGLPVTQMTVEEHMYIQAASNGAGGLAISGYCYANDIGGHWRGLTNLEGSGYVVPLSQQGRLNMVSFSGNDLELIFALTGLWEQSAIATPAPSTSIGYLMGPGALTGRLKYPGAPGIMGQWHYPSEEQPTP